jgi:hypothetical protein
MSAVVPARENLLPSTASSEAVRLSDKLSKENCMTGIWISIDLPLPQRDDEGSAKIDSRRLLWRLTA